MKKALLVFFLLLIATLCFASDSYSLNISHADMVRVRDPYILLSGNISLTFKTDGGENYTLSAQKVEIDTENKTLDASGSVVLSKGDKSETFRGETVTLDWEHLDIKVFEGKSKSERTNGSKQKVNFFSQGDSISYAGEGNAVVFENGIVSTKEIERNWSITASQIELLDSDMFFRNAILKIGRVPVFWFPVFYYPSSRLGFNPAVGLTTMGSDEVLFINTTTEIYGSYDMSASAQSVQENDSDAVAGSVLSLLKTDDNKVYIRDGLLYKEFDKDEQLSKVQTWAKNTSSYFVFTADAYGDVSSNSTSNATGVALGYDTKNVSNDRNFTVSSRGVAAYDTSKAEGKRFRFAEDFSVNAKYKNFNFSLSVPYYSDPDVKKDFYNRISTFSLDSVFGTKQTIPSTNGSSISSYSMSLNTNTSKNIGKFVFNLSSLKANINFQKLTDSSGAFEKYAVSSMSLPTMSFSSNGTFFDFTTEAKSKTFEVNYKNGIAKDNQNKLNRLDEGEEERLSGLLDAPEVSGTKTNTTTGAQLKLSYSLNYNLDNYYSKSQLKDSEFDNDTLSSKINGSLVLNGKAPGNWFTFSDTLTPGYSRNADNSTKNSSDSKIVLSHSVSFNNSLTANIPELGISYSLNQKLYSNSISQNKVGNRVENPLYGEWNSKDVTTHSLSFNKTFGPVAIGLASTLKPVTESFKPTISLSRSGFSLSGAFAIRRKENEEKFTKDKATMNLSYGNSYLSASLNNTYDFAKEDEGWKGYSANASATWTKKDWNLTANANLKLEDKFIPKSLDTSLKYKSNSMSLTFKNTAEDPYKLEANKLGINLKYSIPAKYFWKNRIGVESSLSSTFNYDFNNIYAASLNLSFSMSFAIKDFMDLSLSVVSANNSFYNYYEEDKFDMGLMFADLFRSFDYFSPNKGFRNTNFNLNSFKVSMVHYMQDWNLYLDASGNLKNDGGVYYFAPELTVYVKWNLIPEIKSEGHYAGTYDEEENRMIFLWDEEV